MSRRKDENWNIPDDGGLSWTHVQVAVLMDIRDELKILNNTFRCANFQAMPLHIAALRRMAEAKPRRITAKQAARVLAKRRKRP